MSEHRPEGAEHGPEDIHLPSPSIWPLITALGITVIGYTIILYVPAVLVGVLIFFVGLLGWLADLVRERREQHG